MAEALLVVALVVVVAPFAFIAAVGALDAAAERSPVVARVVVAVEDCTFERKQRRVAAHRRQVPLADVVGAVRDLFSGDTDRSARAWAWSAAQVDAGHDWLAFPYWAAVLRHPDVTLDLIAEALEHRRRSALGRTGEDLERCVRAGYEPVVANPGVPVTWFPALVWDTAVASDPRPSTVLRWRRRQLDGLVASSGPAGKAAAALLADGWAGTVGDAFDAAALVTA